MIMQTGVTGKLKEYKCVIHKERKLKEANLGLDYFLH